VNFGIKFVKEFATFVYEDGIIGFEDSTWLAEEPYRIDLRLVKTSNQILKDDMGPKHEVLEDISRWLWFECFSLW